jgi:hypothetical protein
LKELVGNTREIAGSYPELGALQELVDRPILLDGELACRGLAQFQRWHGCRGDTAPEPLSTGLRV